MKRPADEESHKNGRVLCRYKKTAHEKRGPVAEKGSFFYGRAFCIFVCVFTQKATSASAIYKHRRAGARGIDTKIARRERPQVVTQGRR